MNSKTSQPTLAIKVMAMPKDANPDGDIFGGWLISQMDLAGGVVSQKIAKGRVVTVFIDSISFKKPVFVGDTLTCFVHVLKKGNTSIKVLVESFVNRKFDDGTKIKVTEGIFTYVKVNQDRKPIKIES